MLHKCTSPSCMFCQWRQDHPIEFGWEKLLECDETDTDLSVGLPLSTQQMFDFVADVDYNHFPSIDATVECILAEAEAESASNVQSLFKILRHCRRSNYRLFLKL